MSTTLLLLPDFLIILLGAGLRRWLSLGDDFWAGLERLVYFVLFPALMVHAVLKTRLDLWVAAPLLATAYGAMLVGALLAWLGLRGFGLRPRFFASIFQCGYRFNSYVALAVAGLLFGNEGIATMGLVVGAAVPLANLLSVWMLARHGNLHWFKEVLRNPLIWATVGGLALNLAGFTPPKPLALFLGRLADASIALGLLAVGAALRWEPGMEGRAACYVVAAVKLLALPLVAWGLGTSMGLTGLPLQIAVLFAALPTASSAYILAVRMGGEGQPVAWLISATTLLSMVTLPTWATWFAAWQP